MSKFLWIVTLSLVVFSYPSPLTAQEADYATLEVHVDGIQNRKGEIGVALFNSPKGYPTHLQHAYVPNWAALQGGEQAMDVTFEGVPFGEYAITVIHDENGNRALEADAYGFPKEGVGFSNDQKVIMSAPSFSASKFSVSQPGTMKLAIHLDYRQ